MPGIPIRPGGSNPTITSLMQRIQTLQQRLAAIEKCVQPDPAGQTVTLKAPLKVTLEAGASLNIRAATTMKLTAGMIQLNPQVRAATDASSVT